MVRPVDVLFSCTNDRTSSQSIDFLIYLLISFDLRELRECDEVRSLVRPKQQPLAYNLEVWIKTSTGADHLERSIGNRVLGFARWKFAPPGKSKNDLAPRRAPTGQHPQDLAPTALGPMATGRRPLDRWQPGAGLEVISGRPPARVPRRAELPGSVLTIL